MAQVLRTLPFTGETWIEFLDLASSLTLAYMFKKKNRLLKTIGNTKALETFTNWGKKKCAPPQTKGWFLLYAKSAYKLIRNDQSCPKMSKRAQQLTWEMHSSPRQWNVLFDFTQCWQGMRAVGRSFGWWGFLLGRISMSIEAKWIVQPLWVPWVSGRTFFSSRLTPKVMQPCLCCDHIRGV